MDYIKIYPENYAKPLQVVMGLLESCNVKLFDKDVSWLKRNWRFFYIAPFMILHFIDMNIDIVKIFAEGRSVFTDTFMIPYYPTTLQMFIKTYLILRNKQQFEDIIDELGQLWRTDNLNEVQKAEKESSAKDLRLAEIAFVRLPKFVTWVYLLVPIVETVIYNLILGVDDEKRLPYSFLYPFDPTSNWLLYGATYLSQMYYNFTLLYLYICADFLLITLCAHLSVEFMLLCEDLVHINPADTESLRNYVKSHQKLIALAQKLDATVNKIMFTIFFVTTFSISFFGLAVLTAANTTDRLRNTIPLFSIMLVIFSLCYFCEKLKASSEGIFHAANKNMWYKGDTSYKKIIMFIMFRSQKPCCLTSLNLAPITLPTFTRVLSTTWSYFSLLNTMYDRH